MRTLRFTDPGLNYPDFDSFEVKIDTVNIASDNCTIYETVSTSIEECRKIGLDLPVPFVTSIGNLKKLAAGLGLQLADEKGEVLVTVGMTLTGVTFSVDLLSAVVADEVDLSLLLTITPDNGVVKAFVEEEVVFTSGTVETATIAGSTLTAVAAGTSIITVTVGDFTDTITLTVSAAE